MNSFRTPDLAAFVKAVLDTEADEAKAWVKEHCQGTTRYGLMASSGALRLKPDGIFVKNEISVANWFLIGIGDPTENRLLRWIRRTMAFIDSNICLVIE